MREPCTIRFDAAEPLSNNRLEKEILYIPMCTLRSRRRAAPILQTSLNAPVIPKCRLRRHPTNARPGVGEALLRSERRACDLRFRKSRKKPGSERSKNAAPTPPPAPHQGKAVFFFTTSSTVSRAAFGVDNAFCGGYSVLQGRIRCTKR